MRSTLLCANTNGTTCSSSNPTSSTSLYTYNGDGYRTSTTNGSGVNDFIWDTSTQTPRLAADSSWDYVYLPGSNVPLEQIAVAGSSPTTDLLLTDANQSVRGIVQLSTGSLQYKLVNYTDYDAYGSPITQSGGSTESGGLTASQASINQYVATSRFGFGEGYTDPTGLIYLEHRYYDPVTGQFISQDAMGSDTHEPYEYSGDNPVNDNDPNGYGYCPETKAGLQLTGGAWTRSAQFSLSVELSVCFSAINYAAIINYEWYSFYTRTGGSGHFDRASGLWGRNSWEYKFDLDEFHPSRYLPLPGLLR